MDDSGGLGAEGSVGSDGLGDSVAGDNTSSQSGDSSGEGEAHFDWNMDCSRNVPEGEEARKVCEDGKI